MCIVDGELSITDAVKQIILNAVIHYSYTIYINSAIREMNEGTANGFDDIY